MYTHVSLVKINLHMTPRVNIAFPCPGSQGLGKSKGTGENLSSDWLAFTCPKCGTCVATGNSPAGVYTCRTKDGGCGKQCRQSATGFKRIGVFATEVAAQAAARTEAMAAAWVAAAQAALA